MNRKYNGQRENRSALITGCSSGFGALTALKLARNGFIVYATARDPASAVEVLDLADSRDLPLSVFQMDVTDSTSVDRVARRMLDEIGSIDVLVNNAGIGLTCPVEHLELDALMRVLDVNVLGVVRTSSAVIPIMRSQGCGQIINISSTAGFVTFPFGGAYAASKHAIEALSDALYYELKPFDIGVSVIQPGRHPTAFAKNRIRGGGMDDKSPYADLARQVEGGMDRLWEFCTDREAATPDPEAVAEAVFRAATDARAPRRLRVGADADRIYALKKGLDDWDFDAWVQRVMGGCQDVGPCTGP